MKPLKNYLGRETDQPPDSIRQLATISDNNRQPPLEAILRGAGGFLLCWRCLYTQESLKRCVRRSMGERKKKRFYQSNTP